MSKSEAQTRRELIDPALREAGWRWEREVVIGTGRVNLSGGTMYDPTQRIVADYLLKRGELPLAVLEAKREDADALDGIQQAERYANRLGLRYAVATNGRAYVLVDLATGEQVESTTPPTPEDLVRRSELDIDWERWEAAFDHPFFVDQVAPKRVRPYQRMAIFETLLRFAQDERRVLLLMATGCGKTFTVFQLIWKLVHGGVLPNNRVLFLTDRNSLQGQARRSFSAFAEAERVVINKDTVSRGVHRVGKMFFANYQTLCEEFEGGPLFAQYEPDFFDLVVVDECHRSGFGDWFGVLEHFGSAYQLGLTATPREIEQQGRALTEEEERRDTFVYFTGRPDGDPAFTYSLKQAIEDGYLVPYLLEERVTNLDEDGFTGPDGRHYTTKNFEREIRLPARTQGIAEDLWKQLTTKGLEHEKTIVFCVDDTHAAFMASALRQLAGDPNYAARITRSERNSHQLERNFAHVGPRNPRIAVTVDLLTTGFDAPDVKNIVFVRPVKSPILYKQMKGRGTRLCEDIDKRFFTIWDYAGAAALEDAEFDGHPLNTQPPASSSKKSNPKRSEPVDRLVVPDTPVVIVRSERSVCLADGSKIPLDEYRKKSKDLVEGLSEGTIDRLYKMWVDRSTRNELRGLLHDQDIYPQTFRYYYDLDGADDVDILAQVGYDLPEIPMRRDRVIRIWDEEAAWLESLAGNDHADEKLDFWQTCLDHYALYGIDDLERGQTYSAPQFVRRFGPFSQLLELYGGAQQLRDDLQQVKEHLFTPMVLAA